MLKRIEAQNFCQYLALVNMLSFNFGFHVHEKAIMLVTIPLGLALFQHQQSKNPLVIREMMVDIRRFKMLKLLMLWTYFPLIYTMRDLWNRTFLVPLDWIVMTLVFRYHLKNVLHNPKTKFSYRAFAYWFGTIGLGVCFLLTGKTIREEVRECFRWATTGQYWPHRNKVILSEEATTTPEEPKNIYDQPINWEREMLPTMGSLVTQFCMLEMFYSFVWL